MVAILGSHLQKFWVSPLPRRAPGLFENGSTLDQVKNIHILYFVSLQCVPAPELCVHLLRLLKMSVRSPPKAGKCRCREPPFGMRRF